MSLARRTAPSAPEWSERLYVELPPECMALFRFLLEARGHLAYFTVLDRRRALVRVVYSPGCAAEVRQALAEMAQSLPLSVIRPPLMRPHSQPEQTHP